ncbi:hypothetical protein HMPREF3227_02540 [Corynebacterium sp. CMW7794]|nr:hypothetical protein HMPREF3227_02540 [Corynebacterium sp. CMW7794]
MWGSIFSVLEAEGARGVVLIDNEVPTAVPRAGGYDERCCGGGHRGIPFAR